MRSQELFDRAKGIIPGGVNSPVRAFGSVGMTPRFIARAKGDRIWDVEGNEYMFLSAAHTGEDLQRTLNAVREFVK